MVPSAPLSLLLLGVPLPDDGVQLLQPDHRREKPPLNFCHSIYTSCCRNDGFGEHYAAMIIAYAYAKATNATYCTTPWHEFGHMAHVGGPWRANAAILWHFVGGDMFGERCVRFTKKQLSHSCFLGPKSSACNDVDNRQLARTVCGEDRLSMGASAANIPKGVAPWGMTWMHGVAKFKREVSDAAWKMAKSNAHKFYLVHEKKDLLKYFDPSMAVANLAVHIRRGDLANQNLPVQKTRYRRDEVSDSTEIGCITQALDAMGGEFGGDTSQILVHIFSEGDPMQFAEHQRVLEPMSAGVQVHVAPDADANSYELRAAFHHMVDADGLLIAESSLSAAAMLLRDAYDKPTYTFCNRAMSRKDQIQPGLGWP